MENSQDICQPLHKWLHSSKLNPSSEYGMLRETSRATSQTIQIMLHVNKPQSFWNNVRSTYEKKVELFSH